MFCNTACTWFSHGFSQRYQTSRGQNSAPSNRTKLQSEKFASVKENWPRMKMKWCTRNYRGRKEWEWEGCFGSRTQSGEWSNLIRGESVGAPEILSNGITKSKFALRATILWNPWNHCPQPVKLNPISSTLPLTNLMLLNMYVNQPTTTQALIKCFLSNVSVPRERI